MKTKKTILLTLLAVMSTILIYPQVNTAIYSGSIGACTTYNNPGVIYNSSTTGYIINNGINVSVDQNRYGGYLTLQGNGGLNFSGYNGFYFNQNGSDTYCTPPGCTPASLYLCHSQRNNSFTTLNGYTVTPSVSGNIYGMSYKNYGINNMCGATVCTAYDVTGNFFNSSSPSTITITFDRKVSNVHLLITSFSNDEQFTITTDGGNPTLSTCFGAVISGNQINGASTTPSPIDVCIGGIWYSSLTLTTTNASVDIGYGYSSATAL